MYESARSPLYSRGFLDLGLNQQRLGQFNNDGTPGKTREQWPRISGPESLCWERQGVAPAHTHLPVAQMIAPSNCLSEAVTTMPSGPLELQKLAIIWRTAEGITLQLLTACVSDSTIRCRVVMSHGPVQSAVGQGAPPSSWLHCSSLRQHNYM